MAENKPFFSIVVPCYNDGKYAEGNYLDKLLLNLYQQGLDRNDLEVIVVDDRSPVSFADILEKYASKLHIRYFCTSEAGLQCPGNARQLGVDMAQGEWLTFIDHDDTFYPGVLARVKADLIKRGEKYFGLSAFARVNEEGEVLERYPMTMNWCHGKFYNLENFWKAYNIHFVFNLASHEDSAICAQVSCALHALGDQEVAYFPYAVYAWTDSPNSLCHRTYTTDDGIERSFLETHFNDYLIATAYIYFLKYEENIISKDYATYRFAETMCFCYFYMQAFQFAHPTLYLAKNLSLCATCLKDGLELLDMTITDVYNKIIANGAKMYRTIRAAAEMGSGPYVPFKGLKEWLDWIGLSNLE